PTTALEDWKYTNPAPLTDRSFQLAVDGARNGAAALASTPRLETGYELVYVNGRFAPTFSAIGTLPTGAIVTSLAEALKARPELIEPHLARYASFGSPAESLTALNTAFIHDGVFIYVPLGVALDAPIHCLFVSLGGDEATVTHPRTLIVAGEGSRATVVEHYLGDGMYWTNAVTEAVLGAGASLTHDRVQRDAPQAFHVGTVAVEQAADSRYHSRSISLGGALVRNAISTRLDAPG